MVEKEYFVSNIKQIMNLEAFLCESCDKDLTYFIASASPIYKEKESFLLLFKYCPNCGNKLDEKKLSLYLNKFEEIYLTHGENEGVEGGA